jgi:hypothetical protein
MSTTITLIPNCSASLGSQGRGFDPEHVRGLLAVVEAAG